MPLYPDLPARCTATIVRHIATVLAVVVFAVWPFAYTTASTR